MRKTLAIVAMSIGIGTLGAPAAWAGNVESPWFDQVMMEREIDAKDPWQRAQIKIPALSTMDPMGISSGELPGLAQIIGNSNSGNDGVFGIIGGSSGFGASNFGAMGSAGSNVGGGGLGILGNTPSGNLGLGGPIF